MGFIVMYGYGIINLKDLIRQHNLCEIMEGQANLEHLVMGHFVLNIS